MSAPRHPDPGLARLRVLRLLSPPDFRFFFVAASASPFDCWSESKGLSRRTPGGRRRASATSAMEKGERKKNFKKGIDSDDARRRREETTIRIRCVLI